VLNPRQKAYRGSCWVIMLFQFNQCTKSKNISRATRCTLYQTVIRSVVGHGAEIWAINKSADKTLMTFERKILTKTL
jgi:hypothetical protein